MLRDASYLDQSKHPLAAGWLYSRPHTVRAGELLQATRQLCIDQVETSVVVVRSGANYL
jgi:hypothetical protein